MLTCTWSDAYASSTFCDVSIMGEYPLCPSIDYYYESTVNPNSAAPDIEDAFIAKFNSSNELIWSTFIGGNKIDFATDITKKGYALYLIGSTHSACINNSAEDFPQIALPSPAYFQLGNASNAACLNCHDGFISKFDLSPPVGINEFDKIKGLLSLYPNPTHETLSIGLNTNESGTYYLLDILGNQIISGKINNSSNATTILDLSNYSPGVYVLEIVCDKFTLIEKIVKQ